MAHFLLGLTALALATVVAIEAGCSSTGADAPRGRRAGCGGRRLRRPPRLCRARRHGRRRDRIRPAPGADEEVERLGIAITDTVYVHVRVAAVFGIGVLARRLVPHRARPLPGVVRLWALLVAVLGAQASRRGAVPERASVGPCSFQSRSPPRSGVRRRARLRSGARRRGSTDRDSEHGPEACSESAERPSLSGRFSSARSAAGTTAARARRSPPATSAAWGADGSRTSTPRLFVDFQATRPNVSLDEGQTRRSTGPRARSCAARVPAPSATPSSSSVSSRTTAGARSRGFGELSTDLGVEMVVTLGALLADVPTRARHRSPVLRPTRSSSTSSGSSSPLRGPDRHRRRAPRRLPAPGLPRQPLGCRTALRVARSEPLAAPGRSASGSRRLRHLDRRRRARRRGGVLRRPGVAGRRERLRRGGVRREARAARRLARLARGVGRTSVR